MAERGRRSAAIGRRRRPSARAGLARPARSSGRPLWLGRPCEAEAAAAEEEREEEAAAVAAGAAAAARPVSSRWSPLRDDTVREEPRGGGGGGVGASPALRRAEPRPHSGERARARAGPQGGGEARSCPRLSLLRAGALGCGQSPGVPQTRCDRPRCRWAALTGGAGLPQGCQELHGRYRGRGCVWDLHLLISCCKDWGPSAAG